MTLNKNSLVAQEQQKKTLDQIVGEALSITQEIIAAGGELTPELEQKLEFNQLELARKVDGYAFFDERFQAEEAYWSKKAESYKKIAKSFDTLRDRLRGRIKQIMVESGEKEIKGYDARFVLSKSKPKLVIESEASLPAQYKMQVTTTQPDKEQIKKTLEEGWEVEGARLEEVYTLRVYENKE